MKLSFWSDEDRLFVPRQFGFGWSLNLKFIAKKLGWIKSPPRGRQRDGTSREQPSGERPRRSRSERLKKQIEDSRYEERR